MTISEAGGDYVFIVFWSLSSSCVPVRSCPIYGVGLTKLSRPSTSPMVNICLDSFETFELRAFVT